ncbi:MAG: hypothetical protein ACLR6B_01040 [Blautia sp.]
MSGVQAVPKTCRSVIPPETSRTERQREVIGKIVDKVKTMGISNLMDSMVNDVPEGAHQLL